MSKPKQPELNELLDFSEAEAKGRATALQTIPKVEVIDRDQDPANRKPSLTEKNSQPFSPAWLWISLGSFVLAQVLMRGVILASVASIHGAFLMEALVDIFTYFLGGFMVGVVSPKIRVLEPAAAAMIAMALTLNVGMFLPMNWLTGGLGKTIFMMGVVGYTAYQGACLGERLTRQMD